MPTRSGLLLFSTLAVSIGSLIYHYRKKHKREFTVCETINQVTSVIVPDQTSVTSNVDSTVVNNNLFLPLQQNTKTFDSVCKFDSNTSVTLIPSTSCKSELFSAQLTNSIMSVGSETDCVVTPDSSELSCSPESRVFINVPPEGFSDPQYDIDESNPEELDGRILPKVLIPSDIWAEAVDQDVWHETFYIPSHMGGVLIGRLGKNVRELRNIWQAEFNLNTCPGKQDTLLFKLSCPLKHKDDVLSWVSQRFRMKPSKTTIGNPNQLKRNLPLGEPIPVLVRSLYGAKELFLTVPDEEYSRYLEMQAELDKDYSGSRNLRIQLCEPVTSGTVAVVPHSDGFARALIISVYQTWPKTVFYFLLDHGTFGVIQLNKLKKIRAKYMRVAFQAIHVSWAHAFPIFSDIPDLHLLRTFFNSYRTHAFAVRMETCCRASVCFGEPFAQPYSPNGLLDTLVTACNSGLFMAAPLILYSKRQCWLNDSDTPYYPFTYSAMDYHSLVSFAIEDHEDEAKSNVNRMKCIQTNNNGDGGFRKNWNKKRFNSGGGRRRKNQPMENGKFVQKENLHTLNDQNKNMSDKGNLNAPRQPLRSCNNRNTHSKAFSSNNNRSRDATWNSRF